jgi:uncharacterized protein (TIGR02246 family)
MATVEALEARIKQLEARMSELEEERAIRDLLARYGFNADCGRDDAFADLFTEDTVFDLQATSYGEVVDRRTTGREALREYRAAHRNPDFYGHALHMQGNNVVIHIDGDSAVVNSYSVVLHDDKGTLRLWTAGNNQWALQKVDGQWLIKERRRREVGAPGWTENLDATPR